MNGSSLLIMVANRPKPGYLCIYRCDPGWVIDIRSEGPFPLPQPSEPYISDVCPVLKCLHNQHQEHVSKSA